MKVALFATCLGDQFFADAAADTVRLLRSLDVEVTFPAAQTCCGQPAYNAGYREEARQMAEHTRRVFENADHIVVPSGSCAAMLRVFYPELAGEASHGKPGDERSAPSNAGSARPAADAASPWAELADRTRELSQFLVEVLGVERLGDGLAGATVAYHHGCHALRELGVGEYAPRLLRAAGAAVATWEADRECCGFGGLFSVKLPDISAAMADRKLDTLPPVDLLVSGDGGCLLQLGGRIAHRGGGPRVLHLASALWRAHVGAAA